MRRTAIALLLTLAAGVAQAAPLAPAVRAEVDGLLDALERSGCQFNRNGTWYSGADARKHLTRKREYLEDKGLVTTAEQFITLGAATSSSSGKPYQVRCPGAAPVDSQQWLMGRLATLRAPAAAR